MALGLLLTSILLLCLFSVVKGSNRNQERTAARYPKLIDATLDELEAGLKSHQFTSVDLVNAYLARIEEVNGEVSAVTEVNPDALTIAAAMDTERRNRTTRGPLHGIPILIKNNIATMDKMNNTAGSFALLGATVPRDSGVAAKLRAAGVVIIGKANLGQWANHRGNGSTYWSAHGGEVHGVYYPGQSPSGSSAGSGVSSALGLAFASLGTETSGSIISPSEVSNLVGIKPTVGLTSRSLVIPISEHMDTIGPMARSVKDAAYLLQAIAGKDSEDNYTLVQPFYQLPNYVAACKLSALQGVRIGVPRNKILDPRRTLEAPGQRPRFDDAFEAALETLSRAGATIVDNVNITEEAVNAITSAQHTGIIESHGFSTGLPNNYLSKLTSNPNQIHNESDLRKFTRTDPREDYPEHDTSAWDEDIAQSVNITFSQFWDAYQKDLKAKGTMGVLGLLANHSLDAVVVLSSLSFSLANTVGSPIITVPLGFTAPTNASEGSGGPSIPASGPDPFGISFMGAKWTEEKLIGYAYAFEQQTHVRQKGPQPYIVPRTELADVVGQ